MIKRVVAIDLGGTNLRTALVSAEGEVLFRHRKDTPTSGDAGDIVSAIADGISECLRESGDDVETAGIAVPATMDVTRGLPKNSPALPVLNNFDLSAALKSKTGLRMIVDNDATCAAIGEDWIGASTGYSNSICITLGTGVGGGLIIDGKPYRGIDGAAGEIGHICVEPDGEKCGCGSHGCLEQYSSATSVVRLAREHKNRYPESRLRVTASLSAADIYDAALNSDPLAIEVYRVAGRYLGIALAGLVNVLNPEVVVIGGGMAAAWDLFIPTVREEIGKRAFREPAERVKLIPALLGDDAGTIGVARLAFQAVD